MSWFSKLFTGSIIDIGRGISEIADNYIQTADEKAAFQLRMEELLQQQGSELEQTIRAELDAKQNIMVAELQSGDSYTRRARPTLVYFGMFVIFLNYVLFPKLGAFFTNIPSYGLQPIDMPAEFWWAWGGAVSIWSIGRTMERRGSQQELVKIVTGKDKRQPSLLGD